MDSTQVYQDAIAAAITQIETGVMRIILALIDQLNPPLGLNKIIGAIRGAKSQYIFTYGIHHLHGFAQLQNFSKSQLSYIINLAISCGLLSVQNAGDQYSYRPVIRLTVEGISYLAGKTEYSVPFYNEILYQDDYELSSEDQFLFDKLRKVRANLAKSEGGAAFIVCNDQVLFSIVKAKPNTLDEFLALRGIGPRFIEKYAGCFINEIQNYCSQSKSVSFDLPEDTTESILNACCSDTISGNKMPSRSIHVLNIDETGITENDDSGHHAQSPDGNKMSNHYDTAFQPVRKFLQAAFPNDNIADKVLLDFYEPTVVKDFIVAHDDTIVSLFFDTAEQILKTERNTDRQWRIILDRIGYGLDKPKTLNQIGDELSLSRERIRQLEVKSYKLMRGHKAKKVFREKLLAFALKVIGPPTIINDATSTSNVISESSNVRKDHSHDEGMGKSRILPEILDSYVIEYSGQEKMNAQALTLSDFVKSTLGEKEISVMDEVKRIIRALLDADLLHQVEIDGKSYKLPTEPGRSIGITAEQRGTSPRLYWVALYGPSAQRYIMNNFLSADRVKSIESVSTAYD